jgi:hypothetical protein
VQTIPVGWWRHETVAPPAPVATAGIEPVGGRLAFWALVAFTFVLLLVPQDYLPILKQIRINLLIGVAAIGGHLFAPPQARGMRFPLELRIVLGLFACALLSIPGSYWRSASVDAMSDYVRVLLVFWLIGQDVCSVKRLRIFLWTMTLVAVPMAFTALNNYSTGNYLGQGRIQGYSSNLAENPNDLALTLNLFMPLTAILALTSRTRLARLAAWGAMGLSTAAVVITFSRGGFLTLFFEAALFIPMFVKRRGATAIAAIALAGAVMFAVMPAGYMDRLSTIVDMNSDTTGSAQMRYGDTLASIQYMVTHPIIGAGIGQGLLALNEVRGALWTTVHNAYLNYGVDLGLVGFGLFVWLVAVSFRSARRIEKNTSLPEQLRMIATGVRISLAGFIVAAFFHPVGYDFYFFYLAGLAVALKATAVRQYGVQVPA